MTTNKLVMEREHIILGGIPPRASSWVPSMIKRIWRMVQLKQTKTQHTLTNQDTLQIPSYMHALVSFWNDWYSGLMFLAQGVFTVEGRTKISCDRHHTQMGESLQVRD